MVNLAQQEGKGNWSKIDRTNDVIFKRLLLNGSSPIFCIFYERNVSVLVKKDLEDEEVRSGEVLEGSVILSELTAVMDIVRQNYENVWVILDQSMKASRSYAFAARIGCSKKMLTVPRIKFTRADYLLKLFR